MSRKQTLQFGHSDILLKFAKPKHQSKKHRHSGCRRHPAKIIREGLIDLLRWVANFSIKGRVQRSRYTKDIYRFKHLLKGHENGKKWTCHTRLIKRDGDVRCNLTPSGVHRAIGASFNASSFESFAMGI